MINVLLKLKHQLKGNNLTSIKHKVASVEGWLTENEIKGLFNIVKSLPRKAVIVEIGSWKGKSTITMGLGLKSGKIFAIDPFNAEGESGSKEEYLMKKGTNTLISQFISNIKRFGLSETIIPLKGYSGEFSDYFDKVNFVFIDGDHSIEGCSNDFYLYSPKIKKGGFIAFHDYYPERTELGPTWVIHNLLLNNKEYEPVGKYDSLWIAKKI